MVSDLRDIFRTLRRERSYAAAVVVTLALTIGATTAVFSIVDGVLLKPLSYPEPQQLVKINEVWQQVADRMPRAPINERHFDYWRDHSRSFAALAQYLPLPANLTGVGQAEQITVTRTSGTLFDVLRVQAALGRTLTRDDERPERVAVTVISDRFWRERLNADPGVLGRGLTLDGTVFTVVGVLPPRFGLPVDAQLSERTDAFVPLRVTVGWVGDHNNIAIGRLSPGISLEQARTELDLLQSQVSDIASREAHEQVTLSSIVTPLDVSIAGGARRGLLFLLGAIAAVLLIACSNLANLSLSRAVARMREGAIRSALGASRRRLIVRAVAEQLVLATAGGALGVWVAWAAIAAFVRTAPIDLPRISDIALDGRVLLFAALVSIGTGLLVAILPALRVASADVQAMLRSGGTAVAGERGGTRTRNALLALQVGLSVALLVVTTLLGASLLQVLRIDTGFSPQQVLAIDVAMPAARYSTAASRVSAFDRLLDRAAVLPGVESVSTVSLLPFTGGGQVNFIVPEGAVVPRSDQASANFRFIAPDYFRTIGLPLRLGRTFTLAERDSSRTPAIVSEGTAARLWPGEDPIGKRFSRGIEREPGFEVIGVANEARTTSLERESPLMVYVPYWWQTRVTTSLLLKTAGAPEALTASVRRAIAEIDPEIAIGQTRTVGQLVERAIAPRRYQATLFTVFGVVALFIAAIGVYSITAYGVSRRRREMNIRAALGARTSEVRAMIVWQTGPPMIIGIVGGIAGAIALSSVVRSLLFDVGATDPRIIAAVVSVVSVVGVTTAAIAVRRNASIDPAAALREP